MAANKTTLIETLKSIFNDMKDMTSGGDEYLAEKLGDAVDAYAKTLSIPAGSVIVSVSGGSGAARRGNV
jgi:hypothetical protein